MNYYDILEVPPHATQKEIKESYKQLVKRYHPDIYIGDKTFAEKKMKDINMAYDILSNPEKKAEYDNDMISKQITYSSYDSQNHSYTSQDSYTNSSSNRSTYNHNTNSYNDDWFYANHHRTYTNYHYSNTTHTNNSTSYQNTEDNNYSDKLFQYTDKLSLKNKMRIIIFILGIYFLFLLLTLLQFKSYFNANTIDKKNTNSFHTYQNTTSPYDSTDHSKTNANHSQNFHINDYFTDKEIQELYEDYQESNDQFKSFEEFKQYLEQYLTTYFE